MSFTMSLWSIQNETLEELGKTKLDQENRLESWIANDIGILGLDILIIGRQVATEYRGRIDLLGIDSDGDLIVIELKRDKTPRDIVAQILDYASWIKDLTQVQIDRIATEYLKEPLQSAFVKRFEIALPENINVSHGMVIVASEMDETSERIVHYLSSVHGININVIFFNFFNYNGTELLGRSWLMDPDDVIDRSESKIKSPWSGYWFVNVGEGEHRNWDDFKRYGFISAGQGPKYSKSLKKLKTGDYIFAYMKGLGYVGYGKVIRDAVPIRDYVDSTLKKLYELDLKQPNIKDNMDNPEMSEWIVEIEWIKTFERENAKKFQGIFANQNVACKLRDNSTLEFLKKEFDIH
ncbi:PDDEXK family nuclease [Candidatus Methanoperedens nitratireducens]|uniref:Putative nuclease of the RecB family n=1 Tax=Candidatus Methanoperedens nitratireducens TaxID=1392998 RepID=A0A284VL55_9EURY|nr:endonuclease NucS domain-containing protein [Candidatus Methanoperedens nitroreducens]SNQ59939.1 putative nuclease of the RecB family [Candidatus Methanoperedens nitroreducens]